MHICKFLVNINFCYHNNLKTKQQHKESSYLITTFLGTRKEEEEEEESLGCVKEGKSKASSSLFDSCSHWSFLQQLPIHFGLFLRERVTVKHYINIIIIIIIVMMMVAPHEHEAKAEPKPSSSSSTTNPEEPKPSSSCSDSAEARRVSRPPMETDMPRNSTLIPPSSWLTPKRLLAMLCVISLLNYLDRGAIASNGVNGSQGTCTKGGTCKSGTGIQGDFNLNNFQDGVLSSAFMVGLLVASPIFASLAKSVNPFRLIGVGLAVWTLATLGCGFSFNFWSISVCRMLVGVGEASFISLAAPFIDDSAPVAQKTAWLAVFYMCIPAGYAIGYVYGGVVGSHFGWRYAFWVEAILMLPFAILGFVMKPLQLKGFVPAGSKKVLAADTVVTGIQDLEASNGKDESLSLKAESGGKIAHEPSKSNSASTILGQFSQFLKDMKELLLDKVFVINVLGYIAYNFVIGAYSYWGPKAGFSIYNMTNADMIFGGITVVCGIVGTLAGGFALDFMTNSLSNAFKLLSMTTLLGGACCFGAFLFRTQYGFLALFAIGELLVFATQGPVNYVCLHCVKPSLRPLSMAMSTVAIHVFGDVPSSPLVGVMQDRINNWRTTALILTTVFLPAAAIWFIGIFLHSVDRFNEDSEHQVSTGEDRTNTTPLLEEKKSGHTPSPKPQEHH